MATRVLHQQYALFCGGTSGAAWLAASSWAARNRRRRRSLFAPTMASVMSDTIYNDAYLNGHGLVCQSAWRAARCSTPWFGSLVVLLQWARRTPAEINREQAASRSIRERR